MGTPLIHVVRYWCPVLARVGSRLGWVTWVSRGCSCRNIASGSHTAMTGTSCRSGRLAASYKAPGSLGDMRVMSILMTSWVCALAVHGGALARRGSSHCLRRSLRLIAVVIRCSLGIFGSSGHACGTPAVQTVPGGIQATACRPRPRGSGFPPSRPFPGAPAMRIFSCRLPCWPRVASLPFILPRNHTNCFACPLSVALNTPSTSSPSGHLRCMALCSATVKNGHAWCFGFGCGSGDGGTGAAFGAGFGRLTRRAGMPAFSRRGFGLGWACSGAGYGAGFHALWLRKFSNILYAKPWPSRGRCIPRFLFVWSCKLVLRCLRVCSVSVGQDIHRSTRDVPCLRM